MVTSVITNIITAITSFITNGLNNMALTENVNIWGFFIWTVYVSIILYFVHKLLRAVDNG